MATIELIGIQHTGLYPRTRKQVTDLYETIRKHLTPWMFFNSGHPMQVKKFDGQLMSFQGVKFEGSPREVFWNDFIEPFLKNGIINVLENTAEECKKAVLNPEEYVEEAANLLKILVRKVYDNMADIDQKLRGEGFPQSVQRKIVDGQVISMNHYVDEHRASIMLLYLSHNISLLGEYLMPMQSIMRDIVRLIKANGQRFDNIKASVQRDKIFTADPNIPIEEGDIFERDLPSGITEQYRVIDAGFYQAIGGIHAHYQSRVKKITQLDNGSKPQPQQIVYNLIGENSRINIQSHDSSTNVVSVQSKQLFDRLRSTISESLQDGAPKEALIATIDEMEASQGSQGFIQKYPKFISTAADHMTLLAPFMPALAQLLTSLQ